MSKFLRANASVSAAYISKTINLDEVYVTASISFDPSVFSSEFVLFSETGGPFWAIYWNPVGPTWTEEFDTFDSALTPVPETLGTFQTLEVHYQRNIATEAWIDGTSLWSSGEVNNKQIEEVHVGAVLFGGIAQYIDNVKIGTTRGASDLLFDDFESGTFAAWDATVGDVSIVSVVVPDVTPSVEVAVAFGADTLGITPTWNDLAADPHRLTSGFRIDRGRASEFDKTVTGTASIDYLDTDGTLDPTNAGSPYAGEINPMKPFRIRLRNPISGVWSHLFKGFCSEWQYDVDVSEKFTKVTLEASDAFDLLAALEMTPGHHGDTTPAESAGDIAFDQGPPGIIGGGHGPSRIHKALDDAAWPAGPREIFPGNVVLQQTIYARLDQLLSVLFDAADAEFPGVANVYISKSGYVTFHGRYTRFDPTNPDYGIQTWKAGDKSVASGDATFAPISGLNFRRSKSDLINVSVCTPQIPPPGGEFTTAELSTMTIKDDTSIASYGWRAAHYENLLTLSGRSNPTTTTFDVEAKDEVKLFSEWLVHNYKDPKTRVEQIVFRTRDPESFSGPAFWNLVCGVEIGDIVHLETSHPGGGGFNEDFFVEGIHYDAQPFHEDTPDITLTLDVSPKSLYDFNPFA